MKVCHNSTHHPESPVTYIGDKCPACRLGVELAELRLSDVYAEMDIAKACELMAQASAMIQTLDAIIQRQQAKK